MNWWIDSTPYPGPTTEEYQEGTDIRLLEPLRPVSWDGGEYFTIFIDEETYTELRHMDAVALAPLGRLRGRVETRTTEFGPGESTYFVTVRLDR